MKQSLLLLLLLPLFVQAQKGGKDTSLIYIDENLEPTSAKKAAFAGVGIKVENGWLVYALYPDTTPVVKAYYKNKNLTVKEGPYTVYYPKNKKAREGFYSNNKMTGTWRFWHPNGHLKDSGRLNDNYLAGLWKSWHTNGQLLSESYFKESLDEVDMNMLLVASTSQQAPLNGIRTGKYTSWYSEGIKESEGEFKNNRMDGEWRWYHPNGAPSTIETYSNGTLTNLQCFDFAGKASPDLCSIDAPALLKMYGDYKTFIYENLTWPEEARKKKIEGDVTVKFEVSKEGKLQNLEIQSDQPLLQKAVADLFAKMQDWYPAVSHNRVVVWESQMSIPFRNGNYFRAPATLNANW